MLLLTSDVNCGAVLWPCSSGGDSALLSESPGSAAGLCRSGLRNAAAGVGG